MLSSFLSLPPEQLSLLRLVADEAAARGLPAYIVGGFVRDLLLGKPGLDFDIVVEGDAIALARALAKKHGGKVTAHPRFGTATWLLDRGRWTGDRALPPFLDLITARRETYAQPGALPDITPAAIAEDLARRDFTINTLALRLDGQHFGELHDLYNGVADLEQGLVRVLHERSFIDDPTRMFRAVRYEQRYGFRIEPEGLRLIRAARTLAGRLSAERVRHELDLALDEPPAADVFSRLDELGLLKATAAALPWTPNIYRRLENGLTAAPAAGWGLAPPLPGIPFRSLLGYSLWLMDLTSAEIDAIQSRLSFPLVTLKTVHAAAGLYADLSALSGGKPSKWVDRLQGVPLPAIYVVYLASGESALETYAAHWQRIHPKTDGEALKALGVTPGPDYKKILRRLRAAWLDGEVASVEQEKKLLKKLLAT